ncbi:MAG: DUF2292 domain-containing protein [Microgenomates group bacterium]
MAKKSQFKVNGQLIDELIQALKELGGWGSIEIYVQNGKVTQITKRAIKKTNHSLEE